MSMLEVVQRQDIDDPQASARHVERAAELTVAVGGNVCKARA
jgi:hypothetical protein